MRRVTSQDKENLQTASSAGGRLRRYIGATSQLPAALTARTLGHHVGTHGLSGIGTSVLPGIVRWCSHKPVRLTMKVGAGQPGAAAATARPAGTA